MSVSAADPLFDPVATPEVARLAARLGVDLRHVSGSGAGGHISTRDVRRAAAAAPDAASHREAN